MPCAAGPRLRRHLAAAGAPEHHAGTPTWRGYKELATVGIRINRVLHRAALVQGRWTLIPMDTSQDFPPQPLMSVEYTSDSYGFDGGSPISNSHWWEGSGAVRDGLHVAWAAYYEGCYILIERCDANEFRRRVAEWGGLGRPDEGVVDE